MAWYKVTRRDPSEIILFENGVLKSPLTSASLWWNGWMASYSPNLVWKVGNIDGQHYGGIIFNTINAKQYKYLNVTGSWTINRWGQQYYSLTGGGTAWDTNQYAYADWEYNKTGSINIKAAVSGNFTFFIGGRTGGVSEGDIWQQISIHKMWLSKK